TYGNGDRKAFRGAKTFRLRTGRREHRTGLRFTGRLGGRFSRRGTADDGRSKPCKRGSAGNLWCLSHGSHPGTRIYRLESAGRIKPGTLPLRKGKEGKKSVPSNGPRGRHLFFKPQRDFMKMLKR